MEGVAATNVTVTTVAVVVKKDLVIIEGAVAEHINLIR